jgi:hypothetical protein
MAKIEKIWQPSLIPSSYVPARVYTNLICLKECVLLEFDIGFVKIIGNDEWDISREEANKLMDNDKPKAVRFTATI